MTNHFTRRQCRRLAQKMVWSLPEAQADEMKSSVARRYRVGVRRRKILIATGAVALLAVLVWPLFSYWNKGDDVSPAPEAVPNVARVAADENVEAQNKQISITGTGEAVDLESEKSPRATPLTPGTRFAVEEESIVSTYRITRGSVRFETGPEVTRKLVVHVGDLTIVDIGTVFTVEIVSDNQVRVAVSEGRVKVTWPSGNAELKEGTDGTFPSLSAANVSSDVGHRVSSDVGTAVQGQSPNIDWRVAARNGENALALELIEADPTRVRNKVADLLLAADVMRLTGNPKRALPYLKRVVRQFPDDDRRPVAAFTLGKVLLYEIGKPTAAAKMFAIAAQNRSPLAEEAMAREAEAWYRAGDFQKSRASARRYLDKYPGGARAESVRAFQNDTP